jgi:hypothetical protein
MLPEGLQKRDLYCSRCSKDMDPYIRVFETPDDTTGNFEDISTLRQRYGKPCDINVACSTYSREGFLPYKAIIKK